jgi:hypothetical protein
MNVRNFLLRKCTHLNTYILENTKALLSNSKWSGKGIATASTAGGISKFAKRD